MATNMEIRANGFEGQTGLPQVLSSLEAGNEYFINFVFGGREALIKVDMRNDDIQIGYFNYRSLPMMAPEKRAFEAFLNEHSIGAAQANGKIHDYYQQIRGSLIQETMDDGPTLHLERSVAKDALNSMLSAAQVSQAKKEVSPAAWNETRSSADVKLSRSKWNLFRPAEPSKLGSTQSKEEFLPDNKPKGPAQ